MRLGILVNPVHARTHRVYQRLTSMIESLSVPYRSVTTSPERTGRWQARELIEWGAEAVAVLGGDGTLRVAAPEFAAADVPVLVVPTGTANVFGRGFGIASARAGLQLCENFLHGATGRSAVPVSVADWLDSAGQNHTAHFLSVAGIGGDARAVARHNRDWGPLGYVHGATRALFAPQMRARVDGEEMAVWSVMGAKTPRPAGPITVFPGAEAEGEDFVFLAVLLGEGSQAQRLRRWVAVAVSCVRGHSERDPALRYWTAREATVAVAKPAPVQLDGDHLGEAVAFESNTGELLLEVITPVSRSIGRS